MTCGSGLTSGVSLSIPLRRKEQHNMNYKGTHMVYIATKKYEKNHVLHDVWFALAARGQ
jgi:hypothetical protein